MERNKLLLNIIAHSRELITLITDDPTIECNLYDEDTWIWINRSLTPGFKEQQLIRGSAFFAPLKKLNKCSALTIIVAYILWFKKAGQELNITVEDLAAKQVWAQCNRTAWNGKILALFKSCCDTHWCTWKLILLRC